MQECDDTRRYARAGESLYLKIGSQKVQNPNHIFAPNMQLSHQPTLTTKLFTLGPFYSQQDVMAKIGGLVGNVDVSQVCCSHFQQFASESSSPLKRVDGWGKLQI